MLWKLPGRLWCLAACGLAVIGCGRSSDVDRLPVRGKVTHADGEIISGSISFTPEKGRPGPGAVASLVEGEYRFDRTNGPTAGPHRVVITQGVSKEKALKQPAGANRGSSGRKGAAAPAPKTEWTFPVDIRAQGPYEFDFNVK